MNLICLDLEGVLVPEIWIAVAQTLSLDELKLTTRDISDYDQLMSHRLGILKRENITLPDIQRIISTLEPLPGARDFLDTLRCETQLVILSDTFEQFAAPLMRLLNFPTLFCNTLATGEHGQITGYHLRQNDGKRKAVEAFRSIGLRVLAAGDSYNDISMIRAADTGMFFRAPQAIAARFPQFASVQTHNDLLENIKHFCRDSE